MRKYFLYVLGIFTFYMIVNLSTLSVDFLFKRSINNQIAYLDTAFDKGLGAQIQERFPEGSLFSNLIFALSIIQYSNSNKSTSNDIYNASIEKAILRASSYPEKVHYYQGLPLSYGAFYNGWINYTLKKYIDSDIFKACQHKKTFLDLYQQISNKIVLVQSDSIQLLETHTESIWPADNLVCIASLPSEYNIIKKDWLALLLKKSRLKNGLISHTLDKSRLARGSSSSLCSYFLEDIDSSLADNYFNTYNNYFSKPFLGFHFQKEFQAEESYEDMDSGPIVWNYGSVATIMHTKVMSYKSKNGAKANWTILNLLGMPINIMGEKYYLFKQEPMFDIFLLWIAVDF